MSLFPAMSSFIMTVCPLMVLLKCMRWVCHLNKTVRSRKLCDLQMFKMTLFLFEWTNWCFIADIVFLSSLIAVAWDVFRCWVFSNFDEMDSALLQLFWTWFYVFFLFFFYMFCHQGSIWNSVQMQRRWPPFLQRCWTTSTPLKTSFVKTSLKIGER